MRGIALPTAPLTPPPARAQVVEDILNHAEEIAVAEEGHAGEVTLLRLLKVRVSPSAPAHERTKRSRGPGKQHPSGARGVLWEKSPRADE